MFKVASTADTVINILSRAAYSASVPHIIFFLKLQQKRYEIYNKSIYVFIYDWHIMIIYIYIYIIAIITAALTHIFPFQNTYSLSISCPSHLQSQGHNESSCITHHSCVYRHDSPVWICGFSTTGWIPKQGPQSQKQPQICIRLTT